MTQLNTSSFLKIGSAYLIRTVTMYYTGRVKEISEKEVVLEDAAWIADTGRFSECLSKGSLNDVEPFFDDVIVNRDCIVDATLWRHALPRTAK